MRITRLVIPLVVALMVLVAAAPFGAPGRGQAASLDQQEQAFVDRVNQWRTANGVPRLTVNSQMSAAAQWMAEDNAERNLLVTVDSEGRGPKERLADFGVNVSSPTEFGGYGYESGAELADSYFPSPVADYICHPKYTNIGLGRTYQEPALERDFGWIWVIDLARMPGEPNPPSVSCDIEPGPVPTATPHPTATTAPTPSSSPTPDPTLDPTQTPVPVIPGDTDCDTAVSSLDALNVLREAAGLGSPPACIAAGDIDCDADRDSVDALGILRYVASLPVSQPPGCPSIGLPG